MRNYLTLILILLANVVQAEPIALPRVRQLATEFLGRQREQVTDIELTATESPQMPKLPARHQQSTPTDPYYIFNIADGEGFVIVSGDDSATPILAYTDRGSFDATQMPPNMLAWLEDCADQINSLTAATAAAPSKGGRPIRPMLTTQWNQDAPYNQLCPIYTDGNRSVAGCVAVAMAQVMNYHRWPSAPMQAAIPGDYETQPPFVAGATVSAGTRFNWPLMRESYNPRQTLYDGSEQAVAQLMAACGVAVQTGYASWGSGSALARAATALTSHFGYLSTVSYVERRNFSADAWQQLIYAELASGRPVLYGGVAGDYGHVFVIDGYDGGGLFHVNWGWGGLSDGFYLLSVLNPDNSSSIGADTSGEGYSSSQHAVIGVWPNDPSRPFADNSYVSLQTIDLQLEGYELPRGQAMTEREVELICHVRNLAQTDFAGQVYLRRDNELIFPDGYDPAAGTINIPAGATRDVTFTFLPNTPGTMQLSLWADVSRSDGSFADITLDIAENQSAPLTDIVFQTIIYKYDTGEHHIHGTKIKGWFVVKNFNNTLDWDGDVAMVWYALNAEGGYFQAFETLDFHICVPAGEECSFPFEVTNLQQNTYMPFIRVNGMNQTNGWDDVCYLDGLPNAITTSVLGSFPAESIVLDISGRRAGSTTDAARLRPGTYIVGGRKIHISGWK